MKDYINYGKPLKRQTTREIPWTSIICFSLVILILSTGAVSTV